MLVGICVPAGHQQGKFSRQHLQLELQMLNMMRETLARCLLHRASMGTV